MKGWFSNSGYDGLMLGSFCMQRFTNSFMSAETDILFVCNLRMWLLHDIFPRFEQPETRHAQFNKYQECVKNSLVHVICNYESQISVKKISLAQNRSGIFTRVEFGLTIIPTRMCSTYQQKLLLIK